MSLTRCRTPQSSLISSAKICLEGQAFEISGAGREDAGLVACFLRHSAGQPSCGPSPSNKRSELSPLQTHIRTKASVSTSVYMPTSQIVLFLLIWCPSSSATIKSDGRREARALSAAASKQTSWNSHGHSSGRHWARHTHTTERGCLVCLSREDEFHQPMPHSKKEAVGRVCRWPYSSIRKTSNKQGRLFHPRS